MKSLVRVEDCVADPDRMFSQTRLGMHDSGYDRGATFEIELFIDIVVVRGIIG